MSSQITAAGAENGGEVVLWHFLVLLRFFRHDVRTLEMETIVFLVRADPEPRNDIALTQTDRPVVIADAHHADAIAPLLVFQRRMEGVALPERIFLPCELLDRCRK